MSRQRRSRASYMVYILSMRQPMQPKIVSLINQVIYMCKAHNNFQILRLTMQFLSCYFQRMKEVQTLYLFDTMKSQWIR